MGFSLLDDKFLVLTADDIRRYLEDYAEHEPNSNLWQSLLGVLETEQRVRATREARKIRPCPACGKPLEIMSIADSWHSPGGFDVMPTAETVSLITNGSATRMVAPQI